jgi:hypothetical protein
MFAILGMKLVAAALLYLAEPRYRVILPTKTWTQVGEYSVADRRCLDPAERAIVDQTPDIDASVPLYVRNTTDGRVTWRYRTGPTWVYPTQAAVNKNRVPG